jgi:aspartyl-tRNA(Asn)/glutamyl-tRNA(Gln) amidotransferase subunit A
MALATIGTDTGGSIRIPAAACGVVGLKPTFGEVSTDGVVPLSRTFDHVGPLTLSVSDAWVVYRVLLGADATKVPVAAPPAGLRIAVPRRYFCDVLDDAVRARFEEALASLARAGARITDVDIRHADDIGPMYLPISLADAAAYHAATLDRVPERYTPNVRLRLEMGRYILAEDYVRALNARELLRREVDSVLAGHDTLALPTLPIPAPPIGAATVEVAGRTEPVRNMMLRLTQAFNITGHPALTVPSGTVPPGLPSGLQLVGARMETDALISVGLTVEKALKGN